MKTLKRTKRDLLTVSLYFSARGTFREHEGPALVFQVNERERSEE